MNKVLLTAILAFHLTGVMAQNVGINNTDPKAALDVNGGLRTRVLTLSVAGAAVTIPANKSFVWLSGTPAAGFTITIDASYTEGSRLVVYNGTSKEGFILGSESVFPGKITEMIFSDGEWRSIGTNNTVNQWNLTGNSGTDTAFNFIGTTDNKPLVFKINNERAGLIDKGANTALGYLSLPVATIDAAENTAVGSQTLRFLKDGTKNTAIGTEAAANLKSGSLNVAVGQFALLSDTAGSETVAVGPFALAYNQNREGNTAVGAYALVSNALTYTSAILPTQGLQNTAIGNSALYHNQRGTGAIAIGYKAAYSDTAANGVIAIGRAALYNSNNKPGNIAIGDSALYNNGNPLSFPSPGYSTNNIGIGNKALFKNTRGSNVSIGSNNLTSNDGWENTAVGTSAMSSCLTCNYNIAVGAAMTLSKSATRNIALGFALRKNNGESNIAMGNQSMFNDSTGNDNIAIGQNTLHETNGGNNNVAIGEASGYGNTTGSSNVFIGQNSGTTAKSSSKLYIGSYRPFSHLLDSLNTLIYGDFAADSLLLNAKTVVRNNAVVKGFTKLGGYGADVPSIKTKKITGTGPAVNGNLAVAHGLDASKIISVQIFMQYGAAPTPTKVLPPGYTLIAGYEYQFEIDGANILITNKGLNSANIGSKPFRMLITYEE